MSKLGFVVQHPSSRINPLLRAGPSILVCVNNPGLIDSLKSLAPNALYIFRKHFDEQPLDDPVDAAAKMVLALEPVLEKDGHRYDGVELYNEIEQSELDVAKRFRDFQLHCLDHLAAYNVGVAVDNDPTWHPHFPKDWPELWEVKSEVYAHPAATWRCRHEYIPQRHYQGGYAQWGRHIKEIEWLKANGKVVLPHYIGEWGWDKGPPVGPWSMSVTVEDWIQGARDFKALAAPEVIGWPYFGAGLDHAWPAYNLTSRRAPREIVQAVAEYMRTEEEEELMNIPDWLVDLRETLKKHPDKKYARRGLGEIDTIVIHHTATTSASPEAIANYHVGTLKWPGAGYHLYIRKSGAAYLMNDLEAMSYQCYKHNQHTLGLGFEGDFTKESHTEDQIRVGRLAVDWLCSLLGADLPLRAHGKMPDQSTACPGRFPVGELTGQGQEDEMEQLLAKIAAHEAAMVAARNILNARIDA